MSDIRDDRQNSDFTICLKSLPTVKNTSATVQGATNRGYDFVVPFSEPLILPANAEVALHDFSGIIINHDEGNQVRNQYLETFVEIPELMLKNYMVLNPEGVLVKGSYLPCAIKMPTTAAAALVGSREPFTDEPSNLVYSPLNNPDPLYLNQMTVRLKTYQGMPSVQFQNHHPNLTIPDTPNSAPVVPAAGTGNTNVGGTNILLHIRQRQK
tara:strand:- start:2368 stop:3000 length:633 start_codon:yes stop_codon:yes gene_type:complete